MLLNHHSLTAMQQLKDDLLNREANQFGLLKQARLSLEQRLLAWSKLVNKAINADLALYEGAIVVTFLGFRLTAAPRVVMIDGTTALEYTFVDQRQPMVPPVAQFYLADAGPHKWELRRGVASETKLCDADNSYVGEEITRLVCNGLITSLAMQPQEMGPAA